MHKFLFVLLLLIATLPVCGQKIVFDASQNFENKVNATWHFWVQNASLIDTKVNGGLWILQNKQIYHTGAVLPTFSQGSQGYEPIASNTESTKFYSGGFIYLEGTGRGGISIITKYTNKKYASYSGAIDGNGEASLIFTDSTYTNIPVMSVQLPNFQQGNLYILTLTFDKKSVSFYVGKQLIGKEVFRAGDLEIGEAWMEPGVSVAFTNFHILAYTGGNKQFLNSSIEQSTLVANENFAHIQNNGGLPSALSVVPLSAVENDEYSLLFFSSMVKDKKIDIAMLQEVLKLQVQYISPLNKTNPIRASVLVDTVHSVLLTADEYFDGIINSLAKQRFDPLDTPTLGALSASKAKLKIVHESILLNGQQAPAIYVMGYVGGVGANEYEVRLLVPTTDKNIMAFISIAFVGEIAISNASDYIFNDEDFVEMNAMIKNILRSFDYKK